MSPDTLKSQDIGTTRVATRDAIRLRSARLANGTVIAVAVASLDEDDATVVGDIASSAVAGRIQLTDVQCAVCEARCHRRFRAQLQRRREFSGAIRERGIDPRTQAAMAGDTGKMATRLFRRLRVRSLWLNTELAGMTGNTTASAGIAGP